jgi:hypothetical protein
MVTTQATGPRYCERHPGVATALRCDACGRSFCRDCVVSRFITSRSTIWLCRRCASGWSGGSSWGVGSAGRRGSVGELIARYWWALAAIALVALYSSSHGGRLLGM